MTAVTSGLVSSDGAGLGKVGPVLRVALIVVCAEAIVETTAESNAGKRAFIRAVIARS
jgi:hypothetical protein